MQSTSKCIYEQNILTNICPTLMQFVLVLTLILALA